MANLAAVREADADDEMQGTPLDLHHLAAKLADSLWACRNGRATGLDGVPVEALKAGGHGLLLQLSRVTMAAIRDGIPFSWHGGRMAAVPRKAGKPL